MKSPSSTSKQFRTDNDHHFFDCKQPCRCKLRAYVGLMGAGPHQKGRIYARTYPVANLRWTKGNLILKKTDAVEHAKRMLWVVQSKHYG